MAYIAMAGAYGSVGRQAEAARAATAGFRLRDRLTAPLRFNAEDVYYLFGTGEIEKRCSVLSQFVRIFPNNHTAHINLAECLQSLGQFDAALAESRESVRLLASSISYGAVLRNAILAGRYGEAKAAYDAAATSHFDTEPLREDRFLLAFLQTDAAAMQEQAIWADHHPNSNHRLLFERALAAEYGGRTKEFYRLVGRSMDSAIDAGAPLDAAAYQAETALYAAETGATAEALRSAALCLKSARSRETTLMLALVLARSGQSAQARNLVAAIRADAPADTFVQNFYLPVIDAAVHLQQNDPAGAIAELHRASTYDLAFVPAFANLYPSYLRGIAYLKSGQPSSAIAEFQRVLDHPGLTGLNPIGSLAQLQLARAYETDGQTSLAIRSYSSFMNLWRESDKNQLAYRAAESEKGALLDRK